MLRWYLVRTKPNAEALACRQLGQQNYRVYCPQVLQAVPWRGRWRDRVVPLFPGYLFLGLDEGRQALAPVRSTVGVAGVVRFGQSYAVVPEGVIRELHDRADAATGIHRLSRAHSLAPGAPVRITSGPFNGLEGIFQRENGTERAIVLLAVLGHSASVGVPLACVIPRRVA